MKRLSFRPQVKEATEHILNDADVLSPFYEGDPVENLRILFSLTHGGLMRNLRARNTDLPEGVAIAPKNAASCMYHKERVVKYVRGFHAAIHALLEQFPGEQLQILYAGCGPYAPFAMTMATQFSPDQVQFTLLDIHQNALDVVKKVIEEGEAEQSIADIVCANAVTWQPPRRYHGMITETMNAGLLQEPQPAITANLAPHLVPDGILVPEKVEVSVKLVPGETEPDTSEPIIDMGTLYELTKETRNAKRFEKRFTLPSPANGRVHQLCLFTHIQIFGAEILKDCETPLTNRVWVDWISPERFSHPLVVAYTPGASYRDIAAPQAERFRFAR